MDAQSITITTKGGKLGSSPGRGTKAEPAWQYFAWHCTLHYLGRSLEVPDYKAGTAHCERKIFKGTYGVGAGFKRAPIELALGTTVYEAERTYYKPTAPTAFDVLYCIASDARCYEDAIDFEGFCGDFGYNSDSRSAEGIYKACGEESKRLRGFLGRELFAHVLAMDEDELKAWCESPPLSPLTTPKAWQPEPTPAPPAHGEPMDATLGTTGAPDARSERVGGPGACQDGSELVKNAWRAWGQPEGGQR